MVFQSPMDTSVTHPSSFLPAQPTLQPLLGGRNAPYLLQYTTPLTLYPIVSEMTIRYVDPDSSPVAWGHGGIISQM